MRRFNNLAAEHQVSSKAPVAIAAAEGRSALPLSRDARREKNKKRERIKYYTPEEVERLRVVIREHGKVRDAALFEVALGRGLRPSEVGLLSMEDYFRDRKRLAVERVKNGISNEYLLGKKEIRAVEAWIRTRGTAPGALFPSTWGNPISRQRLDQMIRGYAETAQIPEDKRHFHVLRHTCAVRLLEAGADVIEVQDWLGHRDIRSTMVYARVTDKKRTALAKRLQDL